jgi:transposase
MHVRALLPVESALSCDSVQLNGNKITVAVSSVSTHSACPRCGHSSERIHSRYERKLADLPWQGLRVEVRWQSRRFFCTNPCCSQRIFTERLPDLAASHARKTKRLNVVLGAIALACGGEEGARLAKRIGVQTSPDTMLREIRRAPACTCGKVRVLGVDDWALRRGQRYGTILIDLDRHRVVDLLPERSSETFAAWLRLHPEVEVVSRDRGDYYIKGAQAGAPQAMQVADRWHLVHNLQEALVRLIERNGKQLKDAAKLLSSRPEAAQLEASPAPCLTATVPKVSTRLERQQAQRRAERLQVYQQVVELHGQKVPQREIARRLGMYRSTVRKWLSAGCYPERATRRYRRGVDGFTDYLGARWQAGCHNATDLASELRQRGFSGSYDMVRRFVAKWRKQCKSQSTFKSAPSPQDNPRSMAWLLMKPANEREPAEEHLVQKFCKSCADVGQAAVLVQDFRILVAERRSSELDAWLARAISADSPAEMRRFATGLQADYEAVHAALCQPWSNGQTEGQVNRLKLLKRQMYGRAKFDLLRKRVLFKHA